MTFTLYSFADFDRSGRVRWLLQELGLPAEEKRLDYRAGEHKATAYRAKNPFCLVPTLEDSEGMIFDSGAIVTLLLERHPESGMAPAPGTATRAEYLQWFFTGATTLDSMAFRMIRLLMAKKQGTNEWQEACRRVASHLEGLSQRLENREYLVGEQFSGADLMVGFDLGILNRFNLLAEAPVVQAYFDRLAKRPAAIKAEVFSAPLPFAKA